MSPEKRNLRSLWSRHLGTTRIFNAQGPIRNCGLTALNLLLNGSHPLNTAIPPSFLSFDNPVKRLIAPPWLNPASMMRLASRLVVESSVEMRALIDETVSSMPFSSSGALYSKETISNLSRYEAEQGKMRILRETHQDGISKPILAVTGLVGLRFFASLENLQHQERNQIYP